MTPPLLFATGNAHKLAEVRTILADLPIDLRDTSAWNNTTEPIEDAETYEGNALLKARHWCSVSGMWALADDSGIEVDAMQGRPGLLSSRYGVDDKERVGKMLGELRGVGEAHRKARFVCAAALVGPDGEEITRRGVLEGHIGDAPTGDGGFGYDPIFVPLGHDRALAEFTPEEKHAISHRGRAMRAIAADIAVHLGEAEETGS